MMTDQQRAAYAAKYRDKGIDAQRPAPRLPPPAWAVVGAIALDVALDFCWFYGLPPRRRS